MYLLTTVVQPTMRITRAMLVTVDIYKVNARTDTTIANQEHRDISRKSTLIL